MVIDSAGNLTYTPDSNWTENDTFTYTITDGVASDTATVTIDVTSTEPTISIDDIWVAEDAPGV